MQKDLKTKCLKDKQESGQRTDVTKGDSDKGVSDGAGHPKTEEQ